MCSAIRHVSLPVMPATTDTSVCRLASRAGFISCSTCSASQGFTQRNITWASFTASVLSVTTCAPCSWKRASFPGCGLASQRLAAGTWPDRSSPSAMEPPMAPTPMIAMFISVRHALLSFCLISTRRIFPEMVLGSSSTNSIILGYLYGAVTCFT